VNMFAAPEDPNGPPPAEAPSYEPPTTAIEHRRRPRFTRNRAVIGAAVLAVLAVAGVTIALLVGGTAASPPPVSEAAAGAGPAGGATPPPAGKGDRKATGGKHAGATGLLVGNVVSNAGGTLVVAPDGGGANVSVRTDAATRMLGDRAGAPADLPPGARVVVRVAGSGDARTAVSVSSPGGRVSGTVTAVSGDVVTVLQANGLAVNVNAASANPKPAVGDLVAVTGVPDGTTITATRVRVLPKVS
jgi:Domain of unknown function (DUF5666)